MDELIHSSDRRNPNYILNRFIPDISEAETFLSQGLREEISLRNPLSARKAKALVTNLLKALNVFMPGLVFHVPMSAVTEMTAHSNSRFPLIIPTEFKTFIYQTQMCGIFETLIANPDSDMYRLFCYHFWKEMPKRKPNALAEFTPLPKVVFDPSITTLEGVDFNLEDFDEILTSSITHGGHGSSDQDRFRKLTPEQKKYLLSDDRIIRRLRSIFADSAVLTEFLDAYLNAISHVFMRVSNIKITLISRHHYPTYIPAGILSVMYKSASPELRSLLARNDDYQFSSLFWYITGDITKRFIIQTEDEKEEDPNQIGRYESFDPNMYELEHLSTSVDFEKILRLGNIATIDRRTAATLIEGGSDSVLDSADVEEDEYIEPSDDEFLSLDDINPEM